MATENILIKFTSDTSGIKDSITEMQKLGKITEEDAKKFQMMEGITEGIADALKEAGIEAKTFSKAVGETDKSTKSLASEINKARNEAVQLSRAYGLSSEQAKNAAKRVAELKDEQDKLNKSIFASDPGKQFQVYSSAVQGVQGAFQAATGALQVFGVENERITKLAQQFQGVLNLTQGINSVLQLKDVYGQLRVVLGVTTAAQNGLNASLATTALAAAPLVAALAVLGVALFAVESHIEEAAKELENFKAKMNDLDEASELFGKRFNELLDERLSKLDFEIKKAEARGASEKELLQLTIQRQIVEDSALAAAISSGKATVEQEKELIKQRQKNGDELELNRIRLEQTLKLEGEIARVVADQVKNKNITKIDPLPTPKEVEQRIIELGDVINKEVSNLAKDLPQLSFFTPSELAAMKERTQLAIDLTQESFAFISDLSQQKTEQEIANLENEKKKGLITEEQYEKKLKELKLKQAKQNKEIAIFNASIAFGEALINALTFKPANAVPAALILASTVAGLNLARVIATPLPRFKEGTLNVGGGNLDADGGMHAVIHKGEAIIPKDRNKEYHPTIKALYNRQIKASEINAFVASKLNGKIENKVTASFDTRKLAKAMDRGNGVQIENAQTVGRIIASELSKGYNRRNIV